MVSYVDEQAVDFTLFNNNNNETGESLDQVLRITLQKCNGLKNVDLFGKSDPYVSLKDFNASLILGENKKGLKKNATDDTMKGRVVENDLNPEFNENFYFLISSKLTRCKLIVKDDGISDSTLGTRTLGLTGIDGEATIDLMPTSKAGTATYSYRRAPLHKALQMEGFSEVDWNASTSFPTTCKRVIAITVLCGSDLHDGQQEYYLKIKDFNVDVQGGTYDNGKKSKTLISRSADGTAEWNQSFIFVAPQVDGGTVPTCELVLYDDDFLKDDKLSTGILSMEKASGVVDVAMKPRGSIRIQYAQMDLDIGSEYNAEEEKAEMEAELARIAEEERERREAEEARAEAEAQAAALRLAAEQAKQEAERKAAEEKAKLEEELRLAKEAAEAAEIARQEAIQKAKDDEAERLRLEAEAKAEAERIAAQEEALRIAAEKAEEERLRLEAEAKAAAEAEAAAREAERVARALEVKRQNILKTCTITNTPNSCVGPALPNCSQGQDPFTNPSDVVTNAVMKYGFIAGCDLRYIQNVDGKCYYYGGGVGSGAGNNTVMLINPRNFHALHTPGEAVGAPLAQGGQHNDTGGENKLDKALTLAIKAGHVPGQSLRYIQFAGGKIYFYGPGSSSGAAGNDCFRFDRK